MGVQPVQRSLEVFGGCANHRGVLLIGGGNSLTLQTNILNDTGSAIDAEGTLVLEDAGEIGGVSDWEFDALELTGPMAMSDVQAAREEVMANVRGLIESGEFSPSRAGEELVE